MKKTHIYLLAIFLFKIAICSIIFYNFSLISSIRECSGFGKFIVHSTIGLILFSFLIVWMHFFSYWEHHDDDLIDNSKEDNLAKLSEHESSIRMEIANCHDPETLEFLVKKLDNIKK